MIEFSSNAQALSWIFLVGFWLVTVLMTVNLKGIHGEHMGILALLQLIFAIVIGLGFWVFSPLIAIAVLATGAVVFVGVMFK